MINKNLVEAFDQTGDIVSALVLAQIRFWHQPTKQGKSKLTARPGWLVKSHKEWWDELRVTRQQLRTALKTLRSRGIIHTKTAKFRGAPTTHIRFIGLVTGNQSIGSQQPILYTENTYKEEVSKDTSSSFAWTNVHAFPAGGKKLKAQDVLKKQEEKTKSTIVVKNTTSLVLAWERLVPKYHKSKLAGMMKPITWKEKGQLSKYLKAVGKDKAYGAMDWAIANWFDFSIDVKTLKGDTVPTLPQPGVLLKHWDIAVRNYEASFAVNCKEGDNTGIKLITKQGVKVG